MKRFHGTTGKILTYKYPHFLHKTDDEKHSLPLLPLAPAVCSQILNQSNDEDFAIHNHIPVPFGAPL